METRPNTIPPASPTDESARLRRQIDAGARAAEVIKNTGSTPTPTPGQTRRVTTTLNNDFAYLNEDAAGAYAPTNEKFAQDAYQGNVLGPVGIGQSTKRRPVEPKEYKSPSATDQKTTRAREIRQAAREKLSGKTLPAPLTSAKSMVGRAKASTINISAFSWGVPLWLFVQVPFALISILSIGVVAGIDALTSGEGGFFSWVAGKIVAAIDSIAKFVGLDFAKIALDVFSFSYIIALSMGLFMIGALYLQYKLALLNPIYGHGAGLKVGMLMLTIIGLAMPILNLFPFIVLWMVAVWFFPR